MPDYTKSKIYKIEPVLDHDEDEIYIGSTTKPTLAERMANHRKDYKLWKLGKCLNVTSYILFEKYGIENCKIYLIEAFPCQSKDELRAREGYFIKTTKCVNKNVAGRTKHQYYKDTFEEIKDQRNAYAKKYRNNNKEKINEYYEKNKEKFNQNSKDNYQKHKTRILEKFQCTCGTTISRNSYKVHCKSSKHKQFILNNPIEENLEEELLF